MSFQNIGFIGLGLIGGSIAKKMKENDPNVHIYATAGHVETIQEAYKEGLIENNELLPFEAFSQCDHIFLCAPVQKNIAYLSQLKHIIHPDCCITDVGSTKCEIHKEVTRLDMEANFIGGHPMTGSEHTGIANANSMILQNAYYIITPTSKTTKEQLEEYRNFVTSLGSIPLVLDYNLHDYSAGSISHLPHMLAFSLVNLVRKIDDNRETMKTIAAGGFRDITRVASSSPIMWENICESNQDKILSLIDQYTDELNHLRTFIENRDKDQLLQYFQEAKDYRDSMFIPGQKVATNCYELFIDLCDETGEIALVANILAFNGVSIKNIGIIHNREYEEGVLRIEFYESDSLENAATLLATKNYKVYRR